MSRSAMGMAVVWAAVLAAGLAPAATIHVATTGTHETPFDTWAKAATNIHDAVALANEQGWNVLVSNGVFYTTNTVAVTNTFTLASVNGPDETTLDLNAAVTLATNLPVATVKLGSIAGFTLRGGRTALGWTVAGTNTGVAVSDGGVVSNCVIRANTGGTAVFILNNGLMTHSRVVSNATYLVVQVNNGGVLQDSTVAYHDVVVPGVQIAVGGIARRCRIHNNNATGYSNGTTVSGRLENSLVYANYTPGAYHAVVLNNAAGVIENCTIFGNTANSDSGRALNRTAGTVRNTIIFGNINTAGASTPNYGGTIANVVFFSCSPDLTAGVQGNITDNPMFVDAGAADVRLLPGSPCRDSGTNLVSVTNDMIGAERPQVGGTRGGLFHDMGAYEMNGTNGAFDVGFYGDLPLGGFAPFTVTFRANAVGADTNVTWYGWDFDNDGTIDLAGSGLATVTNVFEPGIYSVSLLASNGTGESASSTTLDYVTAIRSNLYVAADGLHQFPYDSWAKAATNIHAAMDAALAGCTVSVGSGTFPVTKEIVIMSGVRLVGQGRDATCLQRNAAAGNFKILTVNNPNALVSDLMIRNGYNGTGYGTVHGLNLAGGTVSNVTVTLCSSVQNSGRAVQIANARLVSCVVTNNGGNALLVGAGAIVEDTLVANHGNTTIPPIQMNGAGSLMDRCRVERNTSWNGYSTSTADISAGTVRNTLFARNYAPVYAAVYVRGSAVMENCTIVSNNAAFNVTGLGAGLHQAGGTVRNCIVYGNYGSSSGNYTRTSGTIIYSLAPELTEGTGDRNLNGDPLFVDPENQVYRPAANSPCVNAGTNVAWMATAVDLDGGPRIRKDTVDMGCYESLLPVGTLMIVR